MVSLLEEVRRIVRGRSRGSQESEESDLSVDRKTRVSLKPNKRISRNRELTQHFFSTAAQHVKRPYSLHQTAFRLVPQRIIFKPQQNFSRNNPQIFQCPAQRLQNPARRFQTSPQDFKPQRKDFKPHRKDFRPLRKDFRPQRKDFNPKFFAPGTYFTIQSTNSFQVRTISSMDNLV